MLFTKRSQLGAFRGALATHKRFPGSLGKNTYFPVEKTPKSAKLGRSREAKVRRFIDGQGVNSSRELMRAFHALLKFHPSLERDEE
jgi:hypothetical protein